MAPKRKTRAQPEEERPQEAQRPRLEQDLGHVVENLTNFIREQARMHNEQMEQMRLMFERNQNQPQPPVIPLRQENSEPIYQRFRKQHPIDFMGGDDPYIAEEWIKSLEVIFE